MLHAEPLAAILTALSVTVVATAATWVVLVFLLAGFLTGLAQPRTRE